MSAETEVTEAMATYLRTIRNPEKQRYAVAYVASWLLGCCYPNADDYNLISDERRMIQIRVSDIIMEAHNRAKFHPAP